ncbi:hypothetical protein ONE63_002019 [Megalurothrips usitatus]|uniref:Uncharacterized protein n=1 Tax=Megalurothrips usitatus TaxID=439358 RepID=A0AAV7XED4_9NEOP|nr:hypothetical protein ONE63_002019 [Megalurothrips usitatus]
MGRLPLLLQDGRVQRRLPEGRPARAGGRRRRAARVGGRPLTCRPRPPAVRGNENEIDHTRRMIVKCKM